jgi:hypothetical protein
MAGTQVWRASRRLPMTSRRSSRSRRAGGRLWTVLNAQRLLEGTGGQENAASVEDDYQRFAAARRGY